MNINRKSLENHGGLFGMIARFEHARQTRDLLADFPVVRESPHLNGRGTSKAA
ncbi:MAG: hypothetical protein ACOZB0_05220 [Pseudomonadota bacterium]